MCVNEHNEYNCYELIHKSSPFVCQTNIVRYCIVRIFSFRICLRVAVKVARSVVVARSVILSVRILSDYVIMRLSKSGIATRSDLSLPVLYMNIDPKLCFVKI